MKKKGGKEPDRSSRELTKKKMGEGGVHNLQGIRQ